MTDEVWGRGTVPDRAPGAETKAGFIFRLPILTRLCLVYIRSQHLAILVHALRVDAVDPALR